MTGATQISHPAPLAGGARDLARDIARAENELHRLTDGQLDAILDPDGTTYLLRPAQEHLRKNEALLQTLMAAVPDVITVLDEAGKIDYQSPAVTRVLGYAAGALIGQSLFAHIHPADLAGFQQAFSETIQRIRSTTPVEFRHRAHDGSWRPLEATLAPLPSVDAPGAILTFRDATGRDLIRAESARREAVWVGASLATDRFLAMLSHELRTLLSPALFGVAFLQSDERFAEAGPTLTMIRRNIELQARLIDELMDFAAIGQHKVRLQLEEIDAHEAVHFVLEICRDEISTAKMEVFLDLRASNHTVMADSLRLQQVMWNLVKNAVKFSPPGSSISILSSNDEDDGITLEFVDHGIGIAADLLPLVFDPFQQGERSMQQIYGGLGLGMYIAKGLVEAQQGTLTVASEGRNRGAAFYLRFHTVPVTIE